MPRLAPNIMMYAPRMVQDVGDVIPFRRRPQAGEVAPLPLIGPIQGAGGPRPMGADTIVGRHPGFRGALTPENRTRNITTMQDIKGTRKSDNQKYTDALLQQKTGRKPQKHKVTSDQVIPMMFKKLGANERAVSEFMVKANQKRWSHKDIISALEKAGGRNLSDIWWWQ